MSGLFIPAETLSDHLAHIVDGASMREIARTNGTHASTVMKRVNRIEEARDHPDIDTILTALEAHREEHESREEPGRAYICAALATTEAAVYDAFVKLTQALISGGNVIIGDMAKAGVVLGQQPMAPVSREIALAALAFGWIVPQGKHSGPVRKFVATPALIECTQRTVCPEPAPQPARRLGQRYTPQNPIDALFRRRDQTLITAEHVKLANEFHEIYALRDTATADVFGHLIRVIPPRTLQLLEEVCGRHTGFETVEKSMGLPARSAKALISFALEAYGHAKPI